MMTDKGLYIYCLAQGNQEEPLELRGLGGQPVMALLHRGLIAVVEECEAKSIQSEDQKVLADGLLIHQSVVDIAWERYETVLPFSFGMVIRPMDGKTAGENLKGWMERESEELRGKLMRLKSKAEYGVQVIWDPTIVLPKIRHNDKEIQDLEKEIQSKPKGVAYLLERKLAEIIKKRLEEAANVYFKDFYQRIRNCVEEIHVEKVRRENPPKQMIMNLSCLQEKDEVVLLGRELEKIGKIQGFDVRFTGPWPPYSFA
ncbi:MAG: GvpL/GvpF family gas vesicle protein [Chlamydiae bacterium]|nr:GvpL/GvpF family gas vesicle protein [Chlamydiota bacterium]MBI3266485.1 GvpL/GvpF family gas vesicle protein [Chlamydiota bacterium]